MRRPIGLAVKALQAAQERLLVGVRGRGGSSSTGVYMGEIGMRECPMKVSRQMAWLGMSSMVRPRTLLRSPASVKLFDREEDGEELLLPLLRRKEGDIVLAWGRV